MSNLSIILISVLSFVVLVLTYIVVNLYNKNVKAEKILISYLEYLDKISRVIELSDNKLKKLDARESFKSDDEVGFFFKQIKNIQDILNDFQLRKEK
jgi:hypothetical protein